MASFNKAIMVGNLTRDPVQREVGDSSVCNFAIAVNSKFKDREEVLFIDVTAWGKLGELVNNFMKKGSNVLVEGRLKLETWTDKDGSKRNKHSIHAEEVRFMDKKKSDEDEVLTSRRF